MDERSKARVVERANERLRKAADAGIFRRVSPPPRSAPAYVRQIGDFGGENGGGATTITSSTLTASTAPVTTTTSPPLLGPCPAAEVISFARYVCNQPSIFAELDYLTNNQCLLGDVTFNHPSIVVV